MHQIHEYPWPYDSREKKYQTEAEFLMPLGAVVLNMFLRGGTHTIVAIGDDGQPLVKRTFRKAYASVPSYLSTWIYVGGTPHDGAHVFEVPPSEKVRLAFTRAAPNLHFHEASVTSSPLGSMTFYRGFETFQLGVDWDKRLVVSGDRDMVESLNEEIRKNGAKGWNEVFRQVDEVRSEIAIRQSLASAAASDAQQCKLDLEPSVYSATLREKELRQIAKDAIELLPNGHVDRVALESRLSRLG